VTDTDDTRASDYQSQLRSASEAEIGTRLRVKTLRRTGHPIYRYDSDGGSNWPRTAESTAATVSCPCTPLA
jgi:hypothetical protein